MPSYKTFLLPWLGHGNWKDSKCLALDLGVELRDPNRTSIAPGQTYSSTECSIYGTCKEGIFLEFLMIWSLKNCHFGPFYNKDSQHFTNFVVLVAKNHQTLIKIQRSIAIP